MTAPFQPGDLVVCVDASGISKAVPQLQCGGIYTIKAVEYGECVWGGATPSVHGHRGNALTWHVHLVGIPMNEFFWYAASRFSPYRPEHTLDEVRKRSEAPA